MKKTKLPKEQTLPGEGIVAKKKKKLLSQTKAQVGLPGPPRSVMPKLPLDTQVQFVLLSFQWGQAPLPPDTYEVACETLCREPHEHRILLHPGESWGDNWVWPTGTDVVTEQARKHGFSVLFEAPSPEGSFYFAYDKEKGLLQERCRQTFASSGEAEDAKNRELIQDFFNACQKDGSRTLTVGGVDLGLLICGENNILYNKQSDGNRVSVRHHSGEDIFDDVRVVLNGAHSVMGNWGKLERRFEYLSRDKRFMFYTTNNTKSWWTTSLRVYYDGQRLADGKGIWKDDLFPIKMVKDPQDRFRALVVDVPYRDLCSE